MRGWGAGAGAEAGVPGAVRIPGAVGACRTTGVVGRFGAVRTVRKGVCEGLGVRAGADAGFCRATAGTAVRRGDRPAVPAGLFVLSVLVGVATVRRGMAGAACTLDRCTAAGPVASAP